MQLEYVIAQLQCNAQTIPSLVAGLPDEQARWKPDPESWSILEVIHHLYDEEREDFRQRIEYTLHRPGEPFPSIEPGIWVTARKYNQRDPSEMVSKWQEERQRSLDWLKSLDAPDWGRSVTTPWGTMHAGDLLAAWAAHDLLHTRQLVELRWAYQTIQLQPYSVAYAGEW